MLGNHWKKWRHCYSYFPSPVTYDIICDGPIANIPSVAGIQANSYLRQSRDSSEVGSETEVAVNLYNGILWVHCLKENFRRPLVQETSGMNEMSVRLGRGRILWYKRGKLTHKPFSFFTSQWKLYILITLLFLKLIHSFKVIFFCFIHWTSNSKKHFMIINVLF